MWKKEFLSRYNTTDRPQICDTEDAEGLKTSPSKTSPQQSKKERSRYSRTRRTRVKRGRPLTAFANIDEALAKKCSCIVIRNKYNIASAIITAIQHSRFKLNLPNRYQQCRYVPIILTETFNFLKSKNASGFKKVAPCAGDFTFLLSFTKNVETDFLKSKNMLHVFYFSLYYILL